MSGHNLEGEESNEEVTRLIFSRTQFRQWRVIDTNGQHNPHTPHKTLWLSYGTVSILLGNIDFFVVC